MAKASTAQWDVFRIKGSASKYLGTVEARDAADAVERAATQYNVADALKERMFARKIVR